MSNIEGNFVYSSIFSRCPYPLLVEKLFITLQKSAWKYGAAIPTKTHSPINSQHAFMFVDAASETEIY